MSVVILVYHKLVARDSSKVSKGWKCKYHIFSIDPITTVLHHSASIICLLSCTIISALTGSFNVSLMQNNFNSHCMIDSNLTFVEDIMKLHRHLIDIDQAHSIWGLQSSCDFMIFVPLFEAIIATIWLVMFLMCGHGGNGMHT